MITQLWKRFKGDFNLSQIYLRSLEEWMGQRTIQHRYSCRVFRKLDQSNASFCRRESDFKAFSLFEKKVNDLASNLSILNHQSGCDSVNQNMSIISRFSKIVTRLGPPRKQRRNTVSGVMICQERPSYLSKNSNIRNQKPASNFEAPFSQQSNVYFNFGQNRQENQSLQTNTKFLGPNPMSGDQLQGTRNWLSKPASHGKDTLTTDPTHYIKSQIKFPTSFSKIMNPNEIRNQQFPNAQIYSQRHVPSLKGQHFLTFFPLNQLNSNIFPNQSMFDQPVDNLFYSSAGPSNLNSSSEIDSFGNITPIRVNSIISETTPTERFGRKPKRENIGFGSRHKTQKNKSFGKSNRFRGDKRKPRQRERYVTIKDFQTPQYSKHRSGPSRADTKQFYEEFSKSSQNTINPKDSTSLCQLEAKADSEAVFPVFGPKSHKRMRVFSENTCSQVLSTPNQTVNILKNRSSRRKGARKAGAHIYKTSGFIPLS